MIAFFAMFIFSFLPGYLLRGLTAISVLCLITTNKTVRFLGSASTNKGVGWMSFSLDWNQFQSVGLYVPWWVTVNTFIGNVFWMWIVVPIVNFIW